MRVVRIGQVFNRRKGEKSEKGIFEISRSKGYADYILRDPADPLIPGTDVPRLRPIHLGGKSVGVSEDEIQRVVLALQEFYARRATLRASTGKKKNPAHRASAETAR
jgi:hypothetical protein